MNTCEPLQAVGHGFGRRSWLALWAACTLVLLNACQRNDSAVTPRQADAPMAKSAASVPAAAGAARASSQLRYALGIVGYNYTEVGIDDYSVNGTGAFNLGVSTEHAGGGKTVCCFGWAPGMKLPMPIEIEWTRGSDYWCRATAMLTDPGPLEPTTFEVHFYPDRHIEVAITDRYSPPRLKLPGRGGGYRVGKDVAAENADAVRRDREAVECREGRFPIGSRDVQQDRERKVKP